MNIQPVIPLPIWDIVESAFRWTWWKHHTLLRIGDDVVGVKVRVQDPENMHATLVKTVRERDFAAAFALLAKERPESLASVIRGECADACDQLLQRAVFGEEVYA